MTARTNDMRNLLDSLLLVETEQLDELLGTNVNDKLRDYQNKKVDKRKVDKLLKLMKSAWKKFIAGKLKSAGNQSGKKQNPKDPKVIAEFLMRLGIDLDTARKIVKTGAVESANNTLVQGQLLYEFTNNSIDDIFKVAAEYAVAEQIPLGSGSVGKSDNGADIAPTSKETDIRDSGLDKLEGQVATLIKQVSPKAAEILDAKLYDGLDLTADQIKALVAKNPNNAVNLLALVGFAYLKKRVPSSNIKQVKKPTDRSVNIG